MRKEDFLMAYRVVISLVEMKQILEVFGKQKILESFDLLEQEDYLFVRKCDEIKLIVAFAHGNSISVSIDTVIKYFDSVVKILNILDNVCT